MKELRRDTETEAVVRQAPTTTQSQLYTCLCVEELKRRDIYQNLRESHQSELGDLSVKGHGGAGGTGKGCYVINGNSGHRRAATALREVEREGGRGRYVGESHL